MMTRARITALVAAGLVALPAAAGEAIWQDSCAACHQIGDGAAHMVGPDLAGLFGRPVAGAEGFAYSEALRAVGGTWDAARLTAYLADPEAFAAGTTMPPPQFESDAARDALVAWLEAMPVDAALELPEIEGDVEYGAFLAGECVTCHRRSGSEGIPGIHDHSEHQLRVMLHAFRAGTRPSDVMGAIARRLDDEQIAALAAYFGRD